MRIREVYSTSSWALMVGIELRRWYVGGAYEILPDDMRGIAIHLGPIFFHLILDLA